MYMYDGILSIIYNILLFLLFLLKNKINLIKLIEIVCTSTSNTPYNHTV